MAKCKFEVVFCVCINCLSKESCIFLFHSVVVGALREGRPRFPPVDFDGRPRLPVPVDFIFTNFTLAGLFGLAGRPTPRPLGFFNGDLFGFTGRPGRPVFFNLRLGDLLEPAGRPRPRPLDTLGGLFGFDGRPGFLGSPFSSKFNGFTRLFGLEGRPRLRFAAGIVDFVGLVDVFDSDKR